ncbi:MAG TPA: sigma-70 family RNA polymerase sigma factor [Chloroflexota bacterium]|nr:sigma-70 family RNA polymerase sigma factor [Chloroflexota bacterium]
MARLVAREETKQKLLQLARERGFVTLEDVARAVLDEPVDLDDLRETLEEAGFELVESADDDEDETDSPQPLAWGPEVAEPEPEAEVEEEVIGAHILRAAALEAEELMPDTPAAIYLRDISRVPLLTAEEEVDLARSLERGEAANQRLAHGAYRPSGEERLRSEMVAGAEARKKLTESNLRLVVSVARKYMGRGLPLLDLIQEGNIGLSRAVEKYDYRKGYRFSTYAYWWIRQAVTRSIADQARTIRVPVHMIELIGDVYKASRDLQQGLGREPDAEEIAGKMGTTPEKVRQILRAAKQPISLETPIGEDDGSTIADFIADRSARAPAQAADEAMLKDHVESALMELNPRERQVLRMRFGLEDGRDRTLGEIGEELGVSRERVRQIESEALAKLRHPRLRNRLREFVE